MSRFGFVLAAAILVAAMPDRVTAQLSDVDRSRLAVEISRAAEELDPRLFPDLDACKAALLQSVESVERYFARATDPANRKAWLEYLDLDPLVEAIQSNQPPEELARPAIDLRYRLIGTAPGLELSTIARLRDAVEQLIEAIRFHESERSLESLARQLESLAARVAVLGDRPSAEDCAVISAVTGVLESSGQAANLVRSLRNTFARPNLSVQISESMVQSVINLGVQRTRPVRDCILGTTLVGDATLSGNITANLLPSLGTARINVNLAGCVVSRNIGYNRSVRIRSTGYGDVSVSRDVTIGQAGLALQPVHARAGLRSEIGSVEHHLALVRNIARKKAFQQKPLAERIAAEKLRQRVSEQFIEQTGEVSSRAKLDVLANVRPLLKRLALDEPAQFWSSTEESIVIDAAFRRRDQLASVVSPPSIQRPFDVAVQVHESVIDNVCAPVLAGRTLSERRLNDLLEKAGRPVPAAPVDEEVEPPFEIDFARLRPVIFEAREQTLRIGFRGTRFAQGSRELKQAMEITALYQPVATAPGTAVLRRMGDVDVDFPGGRRLTVAQAGLKRTIQKKFSDVFPEEVLGRPWMVPQDTKMESLRGRSFLPGSIDARDSWLTITLRSGPTGTVHGGTVHGGTRP
jgi:hypothetical protein